MTKFKVSKHNPRCVVNVRLSKHNGEVATARFATEKETTAEMLWMEVNRVMGLAMDPSDWLIRIKQKPLPRGSIVLPDTVLVTINPPPWNLRTGEVE